jgi:hypothetical protein
MAAHQLGYLHQRHLHFTAHQVHEAISRFGDFAVTVLALHLTQANAGALGDLFRVVVELLLSVHWLVVYAPVKSMPTARQNSACDLIIS